GLRAGSGPADSAGVGETGAAGGAGAGETGAAGGTEAGAAGGAGGAAAGGAAAGAPPSPSPTSSSSPPPMREEDLVSRSRSLEKKDIPPPWAGLWAANLRLRAGKGKAPGRGWRKHHRAGAAKNGGNGVMDAGASQKPRRARFLSSRPDPPRRHRHRRGRERVAKPLSPRRPALSLQPRK